MKIILWGSWLFTAHVCAVFQLKTSVGIEVVYRPQMVGIEVVYRPPGEDRGTVPLTSFQEDDFRVSYQTCRVGYITDR